METTHGIRDERKSKDVWQFNHSRRSKTTTTWNGLHFTSRSGQRYNISRSLLNIIIAWLSYLPLIDLAILAKLDTCSNVCNCLPMISSLVVAVAGHLITHEHTLKVWLIDGNNWENTPLQNYSLCWLERTWWILTEEWVLESPHLTKFGWVILLS